jgi:hypothetical protein
MMGYCENGNEPLDSLIFRMFLDHLSGYQLFKKYSAPWNWLFIMSLHLLMLGMLSRVKHHNCN